ncbi:flavin reductase family protein [Ideonella sp. 4Y16]|uniref:Flavin reductase family protein n=1 Tax=Ideonella alba TaxID=2824118 RepID=A0A941BHK3_9BURK|nr:flavin reductase family protein [Ideonella alba]MBQ0931713.1 flavin reductase family protein [Ideonella alba]MBQ0944152.1 flavin reductase family protein [Ideonella alba]
MRTAVDLPKAYRLINHGPTVLVSARHAGRSNVMAAAWVMALDFDPPKVALVLDKATFTRELILASGHFAISVPCAAQARMVTALGSHSGRETDKLADHAVPLLDEPAARSPLVAGCVAWLDGVHIPEPEVEQRHDLFVGRITGAWADARVFDAGRWHFDRAPAALRTLHHVAGGHYLAIGDPVE